MCGTGWETREDVRNRVGRRYPDRRNWIMRGGFFLRTGDYQMDRHVGKHVTGTEDRREDVRLRVGEGVEGAPPPHRPM